VATAAGDGVALDWVALRWALFDAGEMLRRGLTAVAAAVRRKAA